jgi:anthranilate phosphoribosyltransferase
MKTSEYQPSASSAPRAIPQEPVASDPAAYVRKVGKGRTLLKSLDRVEAASAFALLLKGGFADSQAGAFLQALRIKELSGEELDGLMDALLAQQPAAVPVLPPGGYVLNLASDTPRKGGYASLLASAILAAEGVPVGVVRSEPVLSGNRASWDKTWELVQGGQVNTSHGPDCDDGCETSHAPSALFTVESNDLAPQLRNLRKIRGELGFRSCLHTAEKLLNPWTDKPLVLGISHRHYADRLTDHLARRGLTAKILLGNHGTPDLVLHKETEVWEVLSGGDVRTVFFHPDDLGLKPDASVYSLGSFAQWGEELAKPGHGLLGPVIDYHLAFFRYVADASSLSRGGQNAVPHLIPHSTPTSIPHSAGGVA